MILSGASAAVVMVVGILSGASAAVVMVVGILAGALVLALLIQAVRDVNVAKHTGKPPRARDEHRASTVKSGRALFGRPLTDDEVATGKEAGGRTLDDDELFHRRLAT